MAGKFARRVSILAAVIVVLPACGGGGDSSRPIPDPGPGDVELIVDLLDYVGGFLPYVQPFFEAYVVPSTAQLECRIRSGHAGCRREVPFDFDDAPLLECRYVIVLRNDVSVWRDRRI